MIVRKEWKERRMKWRNMKEDVREEIIGIDEKEKFLGVEEFEM